MVDVQASPPARQMTKKERRAEELARAKRRGELWEPWEDDLLLQTELSEGQIAVRTERTEKSVHERRRWMHRVAAARAGL